MPALLRGNLGTELQSGFLLKTHPVTDNVLACRGGVVEGPTTPAGRLGRQPVFHQGGENRKQNNGSDHHAEQVHRVGECAEFLFASLSEH